MIIKTKICPLNYFILFFPLFSFTVSSFFNIFALIPSSNATITARKKVKGSNARNREKGER
jgi:hypothetical protein